MSGARPMFLSAGFIVEEGFSISSLSIVVASMKDAASRAEVAIVAGDTKVVEKGHGDGCYINTAGIGIVPSALRIAPDQARPGDVVIISGTIGDHGMAVMSVREGLEFEADILSDTAPLCDLVQTMLAASSEIHTLRDPTRGGVASALNEIAAAANVGIVLEEAAIPVNPAVQAACEILGLDPLYVANEGKLLAIVSPDHAEQIVRAMQQHEQGRQASIVGRVTAEHPRMVAARTPIGAMRIVSMQIGEQLPRIC
jgi:hydrogenase expression/formation protein HypE